MMRNERVCDQVQRNRWKPSERWLIDNHKKYKPNPDTKTDTGRQGKSSRRVGRQADVITDIENVHNENER